MKRLAVLAAGAALAASAALAQAPTPPAAPDRGREPPREDRARPPFNRAEMDRSSTPASPPCRPAFA